MVVEALAVGVCGTDAETASGAYGWAPPGRDRLILGHESLGQVVDSGPRGIKQVDGFMAERWRIEPDYAVRVDKHLGMLGVLLEPATVVTKASPTWACARRSWWSAPATVSPGGIICLTGIGSAPPPGTGPAAMLAKDVVLKNIAVFGSVNANRRHYNRAATALAKADRSWLEQLVTRQHLQCLGQLSAAIIEPQDQGLVRLPP